MNTEPRQAERTALVTGAADGIGRALAARLAAEGARVAIVDLADGTDTVREITDAGGVAAAFQVDVSDPVEVAALVPAVVDALGDVDVLVNNAGIYPSIPFEELSFETWRKVFAVNIDAMVLTAQAFLPSMKRKGWGRVINMTSNSIGLSMPGMTHYIASKMAVIGLTRGLASEMGAFGITVNAIAPSITRTPGTNFIPEEVVSFVVALQTIKRIEQPADLAGTVAFLASDDAAFITGQTLYVDGGLVRSS